MAVSVVVALYFSFCKRIRSICAKKKKKNCITVAKQNPEIFSQQPIWASIQNIRLSMYSTSVTQLHPQENVTITCQLKAINCTNPPPFRLGVGKALVSQQLQASRTCDTRGPQFWQNLPIRSTIFHIINKSTIFDKSTIFH